MTRPIQTIKTAERAAGGPAWLWDPARARIVWANMGGLGFWDADSLGALLDRDFSSLEPAALQLERIARMIGPEDVRHEIIAFMPEGLPRAVHCRIRPQALSDGRRGLFIETVEPGADAPQPDVQRLADLAEAAPAALSLFTREGACLYENAAARRLFGPKGLALPDRLAADGMGQKIIACALLNGHWSDTRTIRTPLGERKAKLVAARLADAKTGAHSVLIHAADVTEARAYETQLQAAQERLDEIGPAPDPAVPSQARPAASKPKPEDSGAAIDRLIAPVALPFLVLSPRGRIRSANKAAIRLIETGDKPLKGQPFTDCLAPKQRQPFADLFGGGTGEALSRVLEEGQTAILSNGTPVELHLWSLSPDKPLGFCALLRDQSEWKRMEADLRAARDKADQANTRKTEFLHKISHELRTPMTAVMGFAEMMTKEELGPVGNARYLEYAKNIFETGQHLLSLVDDLLDLSKIETGRLKLAFEEVDLSDLVRRSLDMVRPQASRNAVILRSSVSEPLPPVVGDARSLCQVLVNLLTNAVRYTEAGGQVLISAAVEADGSLKLGIRDTGIGMSAQELERALTPFERLPVAQSRHAEGSGLGLPLAKALTEANKAQFSIDSEPASGTSVQIIFPSTQVLA